MILQTKIVMHPIKPELNDKDGTGIKIPTVRLFSLSLFVLLNNLGKVVSQPTMAKTGKRFTSTQNILC